MDCPAQGPKQFLSCHVLIKLSPFIHAAFLTAIFYAFAIVGVDLIAIKFFDILIFMAAENLF